MPPPTFVNTLQTAWGTGATKTTAAFDAQLGDRIVVVGMVSDNSSSLGTPTNTQGALTWAAAVSAGPAAGADFASAYIWSTTVDAAKTGMTISVTRAGQNINWWGFIVLHWRASDGFGVAVGTTGAGAPSLGVNTANADSALAVGIIDWNAVDGAARQYRNVNGSEGTERAYFRDASWLTIYSNTYANAGAAGAKTVGLQQPAGQKYSIVAIEIRGSAGGGEETTIPVTDTASIADATTLVVDASRAAFDTVGVADATTLEVSSTRDSTDAVGLADVTEVSTSSTREATDPVSVADSVELSVDYGRDAVDTVGVSDVVEISYVKVIDIQDSVGTSDATESASEVSILATDQVSTSDEVNLSSTSDVVIEVVDSLAVADDTSDASTEVVVDVDDQVSLADEVSQGASTTITVIDSIATADAAQSEFHKSLAVTDSILVTDEASASMIEPGEAQIFMGDGTPVRAYRLDGETLVEVTAEFIP